MIRPFLKADLPAVLFIWLSPIGTPRIYPCFLLVRELLPQAEILIHESDPGQIDGFIGLSASLIEGLFVARSARFHECWPAASERRKRGKVIPPF